MPFIPHTEEETAQMLAQIGVTEIEQLFEEVPAALRYRPTQPERPPRSEREMMQLMEQRAAADRGGVCFIGAGAYDHFIPAAVHRIASRGEFYTAYTPYQAEASQGTLQLLYEYQSMMTALLGMEVSNASLYDGASALAEAILMAVRANRRSESRRVLLPRTLHPAYRQVARTLVHNQQIELLEIPCEPSSGRIDRNALERWAGEDIAALVIPQPNFFGVLEEVDALSDWARGQQVLTIGVVNPLAMALLKPPGEWGEAGVDIACGEGQPLGIPLASGGPYFGFLTSRQSLVRQMPGRIVGRTVDLEGKTGFVLTLQAREQHIRRSRATSNICTNQGLMVTAATIHIALMGARGLEQTALESHRNTLQLRARLCAIDGVEPLLSGPIFHEQALRLPLPAAELLEGLAAHGILGGFALGRDYPELGDNALLVCATEQRTAEEIERYGATLERLIQARRGQLCALRPATL